MNTENKDNNNNVRGWLRALAIIFIVIAVFVGIIYFASSYATMGSTTVTEMASSQSSSSSAADSFNSYTSDNTAGSKSNNRSSSQSASNDTVSDDAEEITSTEILSEEESSGIDMSKQTYSAYFDMQTPKYDNVNSALDNLTEKYEGYMYAEEQNQAASIDDSISSRFRTVTLKVPTSNMNDFIKDLEGIDDIYIQYNNIQLEDMTSSYTTVESDLEYYQALEEKYRKMFDEAETLDEISRIDSYYQGVLNTIDQLKQQQSEMNGKIVYSSVYISIEETSLYDIERNSVDFAERAETNFKVGWYRFADSISTVVLGILSVWVYALIGLIVLVLFIIVFVHYHHKDKKEISDDVSDTSTSDIPDDKPDTDVSNAMQSSDDKTSE